MRLYRFSRQDIEGVAIPANLWGLDWTGKALFVGSSDDGRRARVVMALDEPDFVVTVHEER